MHAQTAPAVPVTSGAATSDPSPPCPDAEVLVRLGAAAMRAGRTRDAQELLQRATLLSPALAAAWHGLAMALAASGRPSGAFAAISRAVVLAPADPAIRLDQGVLLLRRGLPADAREAFRLAVAAAPDAALPRLNLGLALLHLTRPAEALEAFDQALLRDPDLVIAMEARGSALLMLGQPDAADAAYEAVLARAPDFATAWSNRGRTLRALDRPKEALACYEQALVLDPGHVDAHWNRALALLSEGRLEEAWGDHEWRWQVRGFPSPRRGFPQPLWQGEDISGRTILLHAEQGFGDAIQFLRYVPMVAARGGRVVLEVPAPLLRLAATVGEFATLLARGQTLPPFDLHAPLLSLPRAFGTDLESIPASVPYLAAGAPDRARWRARLGAAGGGSRIGLVWAGNPTHSNDRNRSIPPALLAPLLDLPRLKFFSLQLGPARAALAEPPLAGRVEDLAEGLDDFANTAAALGALDLLVSVDTAVAHLAGALARPVITLLPHVADWRWMRNRADTPWYPTMRLVRQQRRDDWSGAVASLAAILSHPLTAAA